MPADCVCQAVEDIENSKVPEEIPSDFNSGGGRSEKRDEVSAHWDDQEGHQKGHTGHQNRSDSKYSARTCRVSGAVTLGSQRGDTGPKVQDGENHDGVHPVCCGDSGDRLAAETVHEILKDQVSEGIDAGLDCRGQAKTKPRDQDSAVKQPILYVNAKERVLAGTIEDQVYGHRDLRCNSGDRRTGNIPSKDRNQQDIQHNIYNRGNEHGKKRRAAVTQSTQGGRIYIIYGKKRDAEEDNLQIVQCQGKYIFRSVHQAKQCRGEENADDCRGEEDCSQQNGKCGEDLRIISSISAPISLREQDSQPESESGDGEKIEINNTCRPSDSGKRCLTVYIPHNKGIDPVVELLQDAA